jgi:hypothetical protein
MQSEAGFHRTGVERGNGGEARSSHRGRKGPTNQADEPPADDPASSHRSPNPMPLTEDARKHPLRSMVFVAYPSGYSDRTVRAVC